MRLCLLISLRFAQNKLRIKRRREKQQGTRVKAFRSEEVISRKGLGYARVCFFPFIVLFTRPSVLRKLEITVAKYHICLLFLLKVQEIEEQIASKLLEVELVSISSFDLSLRMLFFSSISKFLMYTKTSENYEFTSYMRIKVHNLLYYISVYVSV